MENRLEFWLNSLDMIGVSNQSTGLVHVNEPTNSVVLSPEEYIAIENARKHQAHYVYFRRFQNRPSVAQVYIYDHTQSLGIVDQNELINLHKQLYSSGQVPMFFVFTKADVRIFNCFDRPTDGKCLKYNPLTTIALASGLNDEIEAKDREKLKAFSGRSFDNGSFWEKSKYSKSFKFSNSAYEKLLSELKQGLADIIKKEILPEKVARKIMVISILIKYLEEREDEEKNRVFPTDFFKQFATEASKFTEVLRVTGAYLKLIDYLAKHFNGGVFQLTETEREFLLTSDLSRFGDFLNGVSEAGQLVMWRLYSFNDLPVELISNIYEEFLGKQPGVVYTPPYLVNFLLDESMPLSDESVDFKILDPACGSGVFLVGAYRRLIYRWRKAHGWIKPSLEVLKDLLKENIYGVELNKEAADLTIFSLSLALCDELTPLQIWKDLKFDDLQKSNILNDDFFNVISNENFRKTFDLVIGNPPFEANLTDPAKRVEASKRIDRTIASVVGKPKVSVKLPGNQVALLFLEQSVEMCKQGGLVCLVQPSGPVLYNNSSADFRQFLFEKYFVPQIVDFTHLSRVLFGKNGDVATAAVFIKNEKAKDKGLLHVTARRTKAHKEKLYFDLDSYDFHYVPRKFALNDPLIWKSNLLGGSRYHQLILRLSKFPNLKDFLASKTGWAFSEGFTVATKKDLKRLKNLSEQGDSEALKNFEQNLRAPFLTGKKLLETEGLSIKGIDQTKTVDSYPVEYFHSTGDEKVYRAPHLLIKELIVGKSIPVILSNEDLIFKHRIVGIHAPKKDLAELQALEGFLLNSGVNLFYLAGTSSEFMVNRSSSFLKKDLDNFKIAEGESGFDLNHHEQILIDDFWNYTLDFRRTGEGSKIASVPASESMLNQFGDTFCKILKPIFGSVAPYSYFATESYICFPFYFGDRPDIDFSNSKNAESHLERLVQKNFGVSLRVTRIVRFYEGNVIYLIKPKTLRYWLKSIALRDADETFSDLRKQGY